MALMENLVTNEIGNERLSEWKADEWLLSWNEYGRNIWNGLKSKVYDKMSRNCMWLVQNAEQNDYFFYECLNGMLPKWSTWMKSNR